MKVSYQGLLKFIIPSSIGVLMFLTPIFVDGRATIGMGILVDLLRDATQDYLPTFATVLLLISCFCSIYFSLFRKNNPNIPINQVQQIFTTSPAWLTLRILGSLFAVLVLFDIGPEWISSPATGGTMLFQLAGLGLQNLTTWVADKRDMLARRSELFIKLFKENDLGFELVSSGAYFAYVRHLYKNKNDYEVAMELLDKENILSLPGTFFGPGQDRFLRLAYANITRKEIIEVVDRLNTSFNNPS